MPGRWERLPDDVEAIESFGELPFEMRAELLSTKCAYLDQLKKHCGWKHGKGWAHCQLSLPRRLKASVDQKLRAFGKTSRCISRSELMIVLLQCWLKGDLKVDLHAEVSKIRCEEEGWVYGFNELAKKIGIKPNVVATWIKSGELKHVPIPSHRGRSAFPPSQVKRAAELAAEHVKMPAVLHRIQDRLSVRLERYREIAEQAAAAEARSVARALA